MGSNRPEQTEGLLLYRTTVGSSITMLGYSHGLDEEATHLTRTQVDSWPS